MTPEELHAGHVVLVTFPFTDLRATRLRPAVVLASSGPADFVVAFITTTLEPASEFDVLLTADDPDFDSTGLRRPSRVRLDKLATLQADLIRRLLGELSRAQRAKVSEALRLVFRPWL